jgi:two-component sensor histidine kinase
LRTDHSLYGWSRAAAVGSAFPLRKRIGRGAASIPVFSGQVPTLKIRNWLLLFSLASFLPLIVFLFIFVTAEYRRERLNVLAQTQSTARALMQVVDGELGARAAVASTLATSQLLKQGDMRGFYNQVLEVLAALPAGSIVSLADESGQQLINTGRRFGEALPKRADLTSLRHVFETGRPTFFNLFVGAASGRPVIGVDVPVLRDGKVVYALALGLPLDDLSEILRRQQLSPGWLAAILDGNQVIVARTANPEVIGQKAAPLLAAGVASRPEGSVETPTLEGDQVVSTWTRSPVSGWSVAIAQPADALSAHLYRNLGVILLTVAAVLGMAIAIAAWFATRVSDAIASLAREAATLSRGETFKPPPTNITEMQQLGDSLKSASELLRWREAERDAAQKYQRFLMAELDHRVKNTLASVQAVARQTLGRNRDAEAFVGRLAAMANAHNLLAESQWSGASLNNIVETAVIPWSSRVRLDGPNLALNSKVTQALSLALHELATNAAKHGALSVPDGFVQIQWRVLGNGDQKLALHWTEHDGPPVKEPARRGFGTIVLERMLTSELEGSTERAFHRDGVECVIKFPLRGNPAIAPSAARERREPFTELGAERDLLRGQRVLLAEDASIVAMELFAILENAGAQVLGPAASVAGAMALAGGEKIDCAVLDVNLNGEMAFPVAHKLNARNVPFIFVTGYGDPSMWPAEFREATRLSKPVQSAELLSAVAALVGRRAGHLGKHGTR